MHEIIAKIARVAVSKGAAFCYAVAVGVAGNMIFHFVQPRDPAPVVATVPPETWPMAGAAAPATLTPPARTAPAATPVSLPAAPMRPAASRPAAAAASLPEPSAAITLPSPATLPVPALKPTAVPSEAPVKPVPAANADPASTAPSPTAVLPPLGSAIEVAAPPTPPAHIAAPQVPVVEAATSREAPNSLEFSDVWHPYRAVRKGLQWAGEQVPAIGGYGDAAPHSRTAAPAAPISLLPSAAKPAAPENAEASVPPPKPASPGPGSGGLY